MIGGKLYRFPRQDTLFDELVGVSRRYLFAFTLLLAVLFFVREVSYSRLATGFLFIFGAVGLLSARLVGRLLRERLYRIQVAVIRAAVVGDSASAERIVKFLSEHHQYGITLVGWIGDQKSGGFDQLKLLGDIASTGAIVKAHQIESLIIAPSQADSNLLPSLVKACYGVNVDFLYLPDIPTASGQLKNIVEFGGAPLWSLKQDPFSGWNGLLKRMFDVLVSGIALILISPILLAVALSVHFGSPGGVLYRQRRVGRDGVEFDCLKFRSMRTDSEKGDKPGWTVANDPRVTPIGKFIRRWSIDELPQLWNIFRGDMSLVGPRPERPEYVTQFAQNIIGYHERHRVPVGLTGWAQVNGLRGDTPIEDRTKYDRYYIENWSLLFDLKIILLTIRAVVQGDHAY